MAHFEFTSEYLIGDTVWYATPEGDKGIVLDISYSVRKQEVMYRVTFGRDSADDTWCLSTELSKERVII